MYTNNKPYAWEFCLEFQSNSFAMFKLSANNGLKR